MTHFLLALLLACGGTPGKVVEICGDGYDNDDDGLADCADEDCFGTFNDLNGDGEDDPCPELCTDGMDNDADGLIDCEDPGCDSQECPEICTDLRDNDKDGKWDCNDPDCAEECDLDGDGFFNAEFGGDDCDDNNADAYPDADEVCDGADNDCNELVDEDDPQLLRDTLISWYLDLDSDGYGQTFDVVDACFGPTDRVELDGDCNDGDPWVNPGAQELCDGLDNDCDTLLDDADPTVDLNSAETWYVDNDGDGFGQSGNPLDSCAPPPGRVANADDCDDTDRTIGASGLWVVDSDGDGFGSGVGVGPAGCVPPGPEYVSQSLPADCNEADAAVNPGAADPCGDGVDWNCDGLDCPEWFEGFEFGISAPWVQGGQADWFAQPTTKHSGTSGGESGNINDFEETWIEITKSFPAGGDISFWHMGSTESGWDFLKFYVDGVQIYSRAGTWSWTQSTFPVGPGSHLVRFAYTKDGSVSSGSDTVWVDDIRFAGSPP